MKNEPPRPADIAFGDLLIARHISSKLGSALTPTSVPPINRGRVIKCTIPKTPPLFIGEPTNEARAESKFICIMPCKEEEDEVKLSVGLRGLNKG